MQKRPRVLEASMRRQNAVVLEFDGLDESRVEVTWLEQDEQGVVLIRRCWWFDEDTKEWALDESSDWYLDANHAQALGAQLLACSTPNRGKPGKE